MDLTCAKLQMNPVVVLHRIQENQIRKHLIRESTDTSSKKKCTRRRQVTRIYPNAYNANGPQGRPPTTCNICGLVTKYPSQLEVHLKSHTSKTSHGRQGRPRTCTICGLKTKYPSVLEKHMESHQDPHERQRSFECDECGVKYYYKGNLRYHQTTVHRNDEPKFICAVCSKTFNHTGSYKLHLKIHTGEKEYPCNHPGCKLRLRNLGSLNEHRRSVHDNIRKYPCELCDLKFKRKQNLRLHLAIHTGEKFYTCTDCGMGFIQKGALSAHVRRVHLKLVRYKCSCGKGFTDKKDRDLHELIHTGEKPHACSICGETFRRVYDLKQHIQRHHTKEKHHKCSFCDKAFFTASNLGCHVRAIHSKEKPYKCTFCEHCSSAAGNLKDHNQTYAQTCVKDTYIN